MWRQSICNCLMVESHSCKKCDVPRKQGFQRQIYGSVRFTKVIFQRRIGRTNRCSKKNVKRSQLKKKAALYEVWGVWNGTFYAPRKMQHSLKRIAYYVQCYICYRSQTCSIPKRDSKLLHCLLHYLEAIESSLKGNVTFFQQEARSFELVLHSQQIAASHISKENKYSLL